MKLLVKRYKKTEKSTLGKMYVDGKFECHTLEDVVRESGIKVKGQTAIPEGTYTVLIGPSPAHNNRLYMRIQNVPLFSGILIHSGNTDKDTEGCILVGQKVVNDDYISGGSIALPLLFNKVKEAIDKGENVEIKIESEK